MNALIQFCGFAGHVVGRILRRFAWHLSEQQPTREQFVGISKDHPSSLAMVINYEKILMKI